MTVDRFETDRLLVRHWRSDLDDPTACKSLEAAISVILTEAVLEHLPPGFKLDRTGQGITDWISARASESDVFLVSEISSDRLIGLLFLASGTEASEMPTIHLGYLLSEDAWGSGLATELVSGMVGALATDGPVRLIGGVTRNNPASARVLQKAGFRMDVECSTDDADMFVITVT